MNIYQKRINLYSSRMTKDGFVPKGGRHLGCCPYCTSGDMNWCDISVRAYCNECSEWLPANFGSVQDGLEMLKKIQTTSGVESTNMI